MPHFHQASVQQPPAQFIRPAEIASVHRIFVKSAEPNGVRGTNGHARPYVGMQPPPAPVRLFEFLRAVEAGVTQRAAAFEVKEDRTSGKLPLRIKMVEYGAHELLRKDGITVANTKQFALS